MRARDHESESSLGSRDRARDSAHARPVRLAPTFVRGRSDLSRLARILDRVNACACGSARTGPPGGRVINAAVARGQDNARGWARNVCARPTRETGRRGEQEGRKKIRALVYSHVTSWRTQAPGPRARTWSGLRASIVQDGRNVTVSRIGCCGLQIQCVGLVWKRDFFVSGLLC